MYDICGDPCRCPLRATDVARQRDVDKEVSRGGSSSNDEAAPKLISDFRLGNGREFLGIEAF